MPAALPAAHRCNLVGSLLRHWLAPQLCCLIPAGSCGIVLDLTCFTCRSAEPPTPRLCPPRPLRQQRTVGEAVLLEATLENATRAPMQLDAVTFFPTPPWAAERVEGGGVSSLPPPGVAGAPGAEVGPLRCVPAFCYVFMCVEVRHVWVGFEGPGWRGKGPWGVLRFLLARRCGGPAPCPPLPPPLQHLAPGAGGRLLRLPVPPHKEQQRWRQPRQQPARRRRGGGGRSSRGCGRPSGAHGDQVEGTNGGGGAPSDAADQHAAAGERGNMHAALRFGAAAGRCAVAQAAAGMQCGTNEAGRCGSAVCSSFR